MDKLNNKKRREIQNKEMKSNKPKMVDFFAGAGGLSCGFTQAGYKVVFANDFEDVCVRTYRYNHPELSSVNVLKGDIRKIVANINEYINSVYWCYHIRANTWIININNSSNNNYLDYSI